MNLVLEIQRGQKEIGQGWVFSKSIDHHRGSGVLPPLEAWLRFHQNSYTPSLFLTMSVFSDSWENSFSGLFRQWHNLFPQFLCPFILVRSFCDWVFLFDRSSANTKQLSISHGGQRFMVSTVGKWVWVDPHRITYDWQELPCTRETFLYHSKVQTRFGRRLSTIGKSLRFTIPYSKANNKSKSVW